jgi:ketosteroid isomerase-like protein
MKMKFKPIVLIIVIIMIFTGSSISAQEWSDEQMEVWKQVESYWELFTNKDLEGFMSYVHSNYIGWGYNDQLPRDKSSFEKWIKYDIKNYSADIYEITPAAISIFDDVAIIHYFFTYVDSDSEGKKNRYRGRYTDILKKQGDKWVLIGDHGGPIKE